MGTSTICSPGAACQLIQGVGNAFSYLHQRLATQRRPVRVAPAPARGFIRPSGFDLDEGFALRKRRSSVRASRCAWTAGAGGVGMARAVSWARSRSLL